jgi:NAD(P)-dependent dehydrogenase (short-subunit alcohol dehydrogenase family)
VLTGDLRGGDLELDVRSRASVEAGVEAAVRELGGLDAIVCNAGRPTVGTVEALAEADWDDGLATNLKQVYLCARAAWRHLEASRGSILSTASIVGLWGSQNQAAYCAAKAAVVMLTKCLALDGAKAGIRANCVCPGFTQTPVLEQFVAGQPDPDAFRAGLVGAIPLARIGLPRDVADAFVYLASDEAAWVTGTALVVDGGTTSGISG